MAYWMRRYIVADPFALPDVLPEAPQQRARLFLERMASAPVHGKRSL